MDGDDNFRRLGQPTGSTGRSPEGNYWRRHRAISLPLCVAPRHPAVAVAVCLAGRRPLSLPLSTSVDSQPKPMARCSSWSRSLYIAGCMHALPPSTIHGPSTISPWRRARRYAVARAVKAVLLAAGGKWHIMHLSLNGFSADCALRTGSI
jgi:hypothetical protein